MAVALGPLSAPLWRMLPIRYQRSPLSGEGARLYGGRWNAKGTPALYLATDPATAVAEFYQGLAKPGTLAPYRIEAGAQGALVPSVQNRGGTCLVLWRWHDAGRESGDGAALTLLDPEQALGAQ